ncbi:hypothetical protein, conserved [Plasmodium ovale]|uniref:PIR protein n=1 Tax=Plasmodium ovale TaxID=36330 RepID=A0A1C3KI54_PLAOA|nr:hypothetical protein, conserved [Plasmodium ovale]SBT73494.1 hypothetical protein, conserved [Plasmodium ovale]
MGCINGSGKENYSFLRNSHYYGNLIPGFEIKTLDPERERVCDMFSKDADFSGSSSAKEMCKEFMYMYNYLNRINKSVNEDNTLTEEDCHFMNYWLNVNLKKNNIDASICVNIFYEKLKSKSESVFSSPTKLEKHLHVIDTDTLENMKLLYKLYDIAVKIINIKEEPNYKYEEHKSCNDYIVECDEKYKEAMDRCLNSNVDYYNALKIYKDSYQFLTEWNTNKSNTCEYSKFSIFPKYDPVLERKQKIIMIIKNLSFPLIMMFMIPLLYKFTPFGYFFREKIKMAKDRWMSPDRNGEEWLSSSMDIEDSISNNKEYNLGYDSLTN